MMYAIAIDYCDWEGKPAVYSAVRGTVSDASGFTRADALACAEEIRLGIQGKAFKGLGWPTRFARTRAVVRSVKPLTI